MFTTSSLFLFCFSVKYFLPHTLSLSLSSKSSLSRAGIIAMVKTIQCCWLDASCQAESDNQPHLHDSSPTTAILKSLSLPFSLKNFKSPPGRRPSLEENCKKAACKYPLLENTMDPSSRPGNPPSDVKCSHLNCPSVCSTWSTAHWQSSQS